ncbi:hypothetical protein M5D96_014213 [Drosophila gunungcola]|uniref:Uncharacterized protein n=1 Tax=Drosophila gunungcola TaxID=103775 RepID=A0A9P9Y9W3_9MUSC|nr:hypothetical protein M5D96_014213 [Drosophila gunungcola]
MKRQSDDCLNAFHKIGVILDHGGHAWRAVRSGLSTVYSL